MIEPGWNMDRHRKVGARSKICAASTLEIKQRQSVQSRQATKKNPSERKNKESSLIRMFSEWTCSWHKRIRHRKSSRKQKHNPDCPRRR